MARLPASINRDAKRVGIVSGTGWKKLPPSESHGGSFPGITHQELDYILNYDFKYRLGREGGDEEEE